MLQDTSGASWTSQRAERLSGNRSGCAESMKLILKKCEFAVQRTSGRNDMCTALDLSQRSKYDDDPSRFPPTQPMVQLCPSLAMRNCNASSFPATTRLRAAIVSRAEVDSTDASVAGRACSCLRGWALWDRLCGARSVCFSGNGSAFATSIRPIMWFMTRTGPVPRALVSSGGYAFVDQTARFVPDCWVRYAQRLYDDPTWASTAGQGAIWKHRLLTRMCVSQRASPTGVRTILLPIRNLDSSEIPFTRAAHFGI